MKLGNDKGFSILEVMVGLVIFTLGLVLLSSMMMVALEGNKWSDNTTRTVQIIRDKIEHFRNLPPAQLISGSQSLENGKYNCNWNFIQLNSKLQHLCMVVTWQNERGIAQACTTNTYIRI